MDQGSEVARFAAWDPAALQQRITWRESVLRQTQAELEAMREAQRQQRGIGDERDDGP